MSGAAKIEAYEMDLRRPGERTRRLVIHAQRLVYLDLENVRLVMAVCDVTDARANEKIKDDVLQQNLVLLQEVRPPELRTACRSSPASCCRTPSAASRTKPAAT